VACGLPNVLVDRLAHGPPPARPTANHRSANLATGQAYVTNLINPIMRGAGLGRHRHLPGLGRLGRLLRSRGPGQWTRTATSSGSPLWSSARNARQGFIDHQAPSFDPYTKFIEDNFLGGARLDPTTDGRRDPRHDIRENASILGNLATEFYLSQPPRPAVMLPTHPPPGPASTPG
jgi:hypothetical protein